MSESQILTGQEFRDDKRRARKLPPALVKELTKLNPLKSSLSILQTILVLAGLISVAIYFWTPWIIIPLMILIATQQQACFVLAHDAAHYRLFQNRILNDVIGRAVATPVGISVCSYRIVHRLHHNHLYAPQDPDIPLCAGYPRGRQYLMKKLLKDLLGGTAIKNISYFFGNPANNNGDSGKLIDDTSPVLKKAADRDRWTIVLFHISMPIAAYLSGFLVEYILLWLVPMLTFLQPILRLRAICEHGAVSSTDSPLKASRTNLAPAWVRFLLFPHHVNYHVEHHLYPSIPHYNLPKCHQEMKKAGILEEAEIRQIGSTLKLIAGN